MSFASYQYVFLFLPLTALMFWWAQRKSISAALWLLSLASFIFYIQWNPRDVFVIAASVALNYQAARLILRNTPRKRHIYLTAVAGNLSALGYFKYLGFVAQLIGLGPTLHGVSLRDIVLSLGISFFTFTQIAYLADCHAGKVRSNEHRPRDYLLFVLFFPHLIAGPILHHANIIPQFHGGFRQERLAKIQAGLVMFAIGLFKKVMIADHFALLATPVFASADAGQSVEAFAAWKGALAYTLQIYFDFSGYSDMAVGSALLIGMHIPFNFDSPYKSTNIIDFWRRWHISLSTFLRDYLYVPLGGNRHGQARRYVNVFITMLLGGVWHGAGMNFVIWGALHGSYITINHMFRDLVRPRWWNPASNPVTITLSYAMTLLAVVVGWVFFRAASVEGAMQVLRGMADALSPATLGQVRQGLSIEAWAIVGGLAATLVLPNSRKIHDWMLSRHRSINWGAMGWATGLAGGLAFIFISADSPFLYFQF